MTNTESTTTEEPVKLMLSDKAYAKMKFVVQTLLPALSTLYFTLSGVWDLPYTTQIIGSLAALATFLGVIMGISSKRYNASESKYDGVIAISENETGGKLYSLELKSDPADLDQKSSVMFKVGPS